MARLMPIMLVVALAGACAAEPPPTIPQLVDRYLEQYFEMYPTQATVAGRHDRDADLEHLTEDRIWAWVRYQDDTEEAVRAALDRPGVTTDDRVDAEVVIQEAARERLTYAVLRRHEHDPLFWTGIVARGALVHRTRLSPEGAADAVRRVARIPTLAGLASARMSAAPADRLSAEVCRLAAGQAQAAATFYRSEFAPLVTAAGVDGQAEAQRAADALATLANRLDDASLRATGTSRLGRHYTRVFQAGLATERLPEDVLAMAEADLIDLRQMAAAYGRSVWTDVMGHRPRPASDAAMLRALFDRAARDRDPDVTTYLADWRTAVDELTAFMRQQHVLDVPPSLRIEITEAPPSVLRTTNEVHAAGPYAPDAATLLLIPVPRPDATPDQQDAFYRDFNRHFKRMIAPHWLMPGHAVQSAHAARHPRKVRALFADPVYVEGWGTFCERLMLDLGWGGPLPRLMHMKKQLENVARVIVDIRVHTTDVTRDEILRFVSDEALQDEQFAASMWTRALAHSPQLAAYHLGYRDVRDLYDEARREAGEAFDLRRFMDDMMALGPVSLRHYRQRRPGGVH
jgi:uncharacterized protein (DUF885 family)